MTHDKKEIDWIKNNLAKYGVTDYRFLVENDCYVCDRNGNLFSVCHKQMSKSGNLYKNYRIRKLDGSTDKYGYVTYRITENGHKKHLKSHRVMLNAWLGKNDNLCVNHKNGNKQDNRIDNLEWCTVAENNAHAIRTGLFNPRKPHRTGFSIPTADWMTIYILYRHMGYSFSKLGRMYRCAHDTIKAIICRLDGVFFKEICHAG